MKPSRRFDNHPSPFLRKGESLLLKGARAMERSRTRPAGEVRLPAVFVNSVPKSGTHLLTQIVAELPSNDDWGTFAVSSPSLTMRERSSSYAARSLANLLPGESARGHLYWHDSIGPTLEAPTLVSFFIYRDPRDVAVSEARYLRSMNRYHRLHPFFRGLTEDEAVMQAIMGRQPRSFLEPKYPDIDRRYRRYLGWEDHPDVLAVRFEDLRGPRLSVTVWQIIDHYYKKADDSTVDKSAIHAACLEAIRPERSHTFVSGQAGGWLSTMNPLQMTSFARVGQPLLEELGYETDGTWAVV